MKVKWSKIKYIVLWLLGILALLILLGFLRHLVLPLQVERVELKTYDHNTYGQRELTKLEERILLNLYNLSRDSGDVTAEPCCDSYGFYIYYKDGTHKYVGEGEGSEMILRGKHKCTMQNPLLIKYIYSLAEKYDMPID